MKNKLSRNYGIFEKSQLRGWGWGWGLGWCWGWGWAQPQPQPQWIRL